MKLEEELEKIENLFSECSGFGDPDARRNAELRLQTIQSKLQLKTSKQLNLITLILAIVSFINVLLVIF
ncbi:MAG: hypothetical protein AB7D08_01000 [Bacteroidales bacterium]